MAKSTQSIEEVKAEIEELRKSPYNWKDWVGGIDITDWRNWVPGYNIYNQINKE